MHDEFLRGDTLLYRADDFKKDLDTYEPFYEPEKTEAVKSRWLQQLAIFRIYNQLNQLIESQDVSKPFVSWRHPISFKYDAKNALLKPISEFDKEKFQDLIGRSELEDHTPFNSIGAFNPEEGYLRIVFPKKLNRIFIEVEYKARFEDNEKDYFDGETSGKDKSTKGLMKEMAEQISEDEIVINHVKNSTISYNQDEEKGKILFIGTPDKDSKKNVDEVIANIKGQLSTIDKKRPNVQLKTKIGRFGAKRVFISTKFNYIFKQKSKFKTLLADAVKEYGFKAVFGDPQISSDISDTAGNYSVNKHITDRITTSDAFLQIIPRTLFEEETNQDWLLYELGVALGAEIPCAICVDNTRIYQYPTKVGDGWMKYGFDSFLDSEEIIEIIRLALSDLDQKTSDKSY